MNPRPRAYESPKPIQSINRLTVSQPVELSKLSKSYVSQVKHGKRPPSQKLLEAFNQVNNQRVKMAETALPYSSSLDKHTGFSLVYLPGIR